MAITTLLNWCNDIVRAQSVKTLTIFILAAEKIICKVCIH